VAPGIAEALLATALGALFAAISGGRDLQPSLRAFISGYRTPPAGRRLSANLLLMVSRGTCRAARRRRLPHALRE